LEGPKVKLCRYVGQKPREACSGVLVGDEIVELGVVGSVLGLEMPADLPSLVRSEGQLDDLQVAIAHSGDRLAGRGVDRFSVRFLTPCPDPPKIWCIGLNYREHAEDLEEPSPDEPASFMRPAHSMTGPGSPICLPPESQRVTGEAELAVVIGRRCKNVSREDAHAVIAGFMPAIDVTAEDILRRNPRFLTRAKSFDTFLSLGPFLVTRHEFPDRDLVRQIVVSTVLNGTAVRTNIGANMRHDVHDLIAFHSRGMTWEAGDILLTGTPGAVVIGPGDRIGAHVSRVGELENPVTTAANSAVD
jgi:2-keto-4-pentenoate hydratase/2-oxohepta-3-ene-1,7-dioic acid hydratase in catechol pathway